MWLIFQQRRGSWKALEHEANQKSESGLKASDNNCLMLCASSQIQKKKKKKLDINFKSFSNTS